MRERNPILVDSDVENKGGLIQHELLASEKRSQWDSK